jgi:hypothetical protein
MQMTLSSKGASVLIEPLTHAFAYTASSCQLHAVPQMTHPHMLQYCQMHTPRVLPTILQTHLDPIHSSNGCADAADVEHIEGVIVTTGATLNM